MLCFITFHQNHYGLDIINHFILKNIFFPLFFHFHQKCENIPKHIIKMFLKNKLLSFKRAIVRCDSVSGLGDTAFLLNCSLLQYTVYIYGTGEKKIEVILLTKQNKKTRTSAFDSLFHRLKCTQIIIFF